VKELLFLAVALLAGCGSGNCPTLAPQLAYCLRMPDAGPPVATLQHVEVESGDARETLLVQVENDARRLVVVGVSPLGQTLLSAQWNGTVVERGVAPPHPSLDPSALLAFAQFSLWDFDRLRGGFAEGLEVDIAVGRAALRLRDGDGRTLLEVERTGSAPPYASARILLPTRGITIRSRRLDDNGTMPAVRQ
jgi:hypothetical protein